MKKATVVIAVLLGVILICLGVYWLQLGYDDGSPDGYSITYGESLSDAKPFWFANDADEEDKAEYNSIGVGVIIFGVFVIIFAIAMGVSASNRTECAYATNYNSDFWAKNSPNGSKNTKANQKLNQAMSSATWRCPVCSSVNASYVGICDCGARKPSLTVNNPSSTTTQAKVTDSAAKESKPVSDNYVAETPAVPATVETHREAVSINEVGVPKKQYCPYCGEKMTERTVFCCACGQKLK